jgi:hypothetical protein
VWCSFCPEPKQLQSPSLATILDGDLPTSDVPRRRKIVTYCSAVESFARTYQLVEVLREPFERGATIADERRTVHEREPLRA